MTEQFTTSQEASMHGVSRAMRTLPESMDRQAYLTLEQHAKSLQMRLNNYQQFIRDQGLEADLMKWCQQTERLL